MPPIKSSDRDTADLLADRIGARVRELRTSRGWTQRDLATQIGMTAQAFARLERGLSLPSFPTFLRLCQILDTSSDFLLGVDVPSEHQPLQANEHARALARLQAQVRELDVQALNALEQVASHMRERLDNE